MKIPPLIKKNSNSPPTALLNTGDQGVAILFVMTAITLLTVIWADFSFETKINKLRSYNSQDQLQARLNAEAGLKLALIRLELYQTARNLIEKNKNIKNNVNVRDLNEIWKIPFIYPIPVSKKSKLAVREVIEKFMKNSLLEGEMTTEIRNASHLINLNLLRMAKLKTKTYPNEDEDEDEDEIVNPLPTDPNKIILNLEQRLVELFRQKFDRLLEEDDEFSRQYGNVEPAMLIKEIKFYINDAHKQFEPEIAEIQAQYDADGIPAKHAPLESLSELYLLRGWDDQLVDMIKHEVTVHGVVAIDLNQITKQGLKLLIPEIDDEQVKDFFDYRDDPKIPRPFNTLDEFKNYIVHTAKIFGPAEMDQRIDQFAEAGIDFGVHGSLFQVISTGRYQRSEYTLNAFVEIPIKPVAPVIKDNDEEQREIDPKDPKKPEQEAEEEADRKSRKRDASRSGHPPPPPQFLPPRVVEITVY